MPGPTWRDTGQPALLVSFKKKVPRLTQLELQPGYCTQGGTGISGPSSRTVPGGSRSVRRYVEYAVYEHSGVDHLHARTQPLRSGFTSFHKFQAPDQREGGSKRDSGAGCRGTVSTLALTWRLSSSAMVEEPRKRIAAILTWYTVGSHSDVRCLPACLLRRPALRGWCCSSL